MPNTDFKQNISQYKYNKFLNIGMKKAYWLTATCRGDVGQLFVSEVWFIYDL